jgi:2-polyprenyl-3-methyl-5-hydroxy-6-metoxy-1,4-benzoquinol methylase
MERFMNNEFITDSYKEIYFYKERQEMLRFLPAHAKYFLDVGCAGGSFGESLKSRYSAEVWGVEPNEYAASVASQKLDKVICDMFACTLDMPKSYFDCIIFNDVLEHLVDPYTALLYCKQLLKAKGVVVASIPNVRYFDNIWNLIVLKDWEYADYGILDRTHLRFFTRKSLLATFSSLGYQVERIEGINPLEQEHPYQVRKFKWLNRFAWNQLEDMRYLQYAVVARPNV